LFSKQIECQKEILVVFRELSGKMTS